MTQAYVSGYIPYFHIRDILMGRAVHILLLVLLVITAAAHDHQWEKMQRYRKHGNQCARRRGVVPSPCRSLVAATTPPATCASGLSVSMYATGSGAATGSATVVRMGGSADLPRPLFRASSPSTDPSAPPLPTTGSACSTDAVSDTVSS